MKFVLDFLMPGMNGDDGLIRQHFAQAGRVKKKLRLLFLSQRVAGTRPIGTPIRVTYTRYTARFMDWDNACASFKHIGDAMQAAGIITDDSPKVIAEFIPRQVKCKVKEQRTEILIEHL